MLYLDTFGAAGGVGRCSLELLPCLARRMGKIVVAGRSHVVDSLRGALPGDTTIEYLNLEKPTLQPGALAVRALARMAPQSNRFTHAWMDRAGVRNAERVFINYPQELVPPGKSYDFDIFVHDLNWRRYPENAADPDELDQRCREWVRQARRVFTNSDFTRLEIINAYGVDRARVISAPLAPPSLPPSAQPDPEQLSRLALKPDGYFFYPAAHGFHKGHDVLADALEGAPSTLPVVITVPVTIDLERYPSKLHPYLRRVSKKLEEQQRAGRIISLTGLSWEQIQLVAGSCRAYVLPSRFEGFGFPLVEAMALGKFSMCSEIPAFREILNRYGDAIRATTFPSGDAAALRNLLISKSESLSQPKPWTPRGWSWDDTANVIANAPVLA